MEPNELTIEQAHMRLKQKELSARELTQSVLDRIEAVEKKVDAYITIIPEMALAAADEADKQIAAGHIRPLTGIPFSIKDLICTKGIRTTCASNILKHFIPPYDATVIEKLKGEGAVIVGKLNMDEFAMGSTTENSGFKITRNPWNLDHIPGGSSGGSAASVASDMCIAALGSDTGGSIRQPASHCGVVGMKPTYGRVSRFGLVAYASSLDQIGPLTKSVMDCALVMNALSGHDPQDSTSAQVDVPDFANLTAKDGSTPLKGMTFGIPKEFYQVEGLDADVRQALEKATSVLKHLGAGTIEVSLPHTPYVVATYYLIAPSEASANLSRYDGVKFGTRDFDASDLLDMYHDTRSKGFGPEVKRRIIIGTYALSAGYYDAFYGKASQVRTLIAKDFEEAFTTCDALITPVAPSPAPKIGEHRDDPLAMYLSDIFTLSANLSGIPGISVPCGFSKNRLPIGLQLLGRPFDEKTLLKAAYYFEQASDVNTAKPNLHDA